MSEEIENDYFKGVYNNLNRAQSFATQCDTWLSNAKFDFDDDVSHASKIREWGRLRGMMKMHLNDIRRNTEMLKREEISLEKFRTNSNDPSILKDVEIIDNKHSYNDLLNSLWNIESQLENKLIFIAELQESEKELFNHCASGDISSSLNSSNLRTSASERSNTRIVSLKVPEFHGQYENYAEFIAGYDDLIHNNPDYSDSAKCMYFKNAIRGKAARIINGIPATGNNYQLMYDKIKAKFSRASLNNHTILLKLENLLPADENAQSLQDKIDDIEEILNHLNAANIGIDNSTDPMWHRIILRKFPDKISDKIVEEHHSDNKFTIRKLISTIENQTFAIKFREEAKISRSAQATQNNGTVHDNKKSYNSVHARTKESYNRYSNGNSSQPDLPCKLCDSSVHTSENCSLPIDEKIRSIKRKRLCWKCFQANHRSSECDKANCECGDNHHLSICRKSTNWNRGNNSRSSGQQTNHQFVQSRAPVYQNQRAELLRSNIVRDCSNDNRPPANEVNKDRQNSFNPPINARGTHFNGNHAAFAENPFFESEEMQHTLPENNLQIGHTAIETKAVLPGGPLIPAASSTNRLPEPATLMTCEAQIYNNLQKRYVTAILFFDTGSQQTLVNENFAKGLGIEGENISYTVSGINDKTEQVEGCLINLKLLNTSGESVNIPALTKPFISKGFRSANLDSMDLEFLSSKGLKIANTKLKGELLRPDILIGADNYFGLMINKPNIILPSKLQLIQTVFGSCVIGRSHGYIASSIKRRLPELSTHTALVEEADEISPSRMLKEMYEVESLGIKHTGSPSVDETVKYYEQYKRLIKFSDNIVTAPLPLKEDISKLNSNYKMANMRLTSLISSFSRNPNMREHYIAKMEEYKREGIIEQINADEKYSSNEPTFFIPHHGVWNPLKENKPLRIVFDASSNQKGCMSLNQALHTGEVFVNKIPNIILSARKSKHIIMCDIQSAYTNIRLFAEDQRLCQFLWLENPDKPATKANIKPFRFKRLPFGINASSSILNMAIVAFLEMNESDLARDILKMLYVDNILLNIEDINELWPKMKEVKKLFANISFNVREFVTNDEQTNETIAEEDKGKFGETKLLGVPYNTKSDTLKARISVKPEQIITRRVVTKQVHSIFDPIGLLAPSLIALRFSMREVFDSTKHWNEQLESNMESEWKSLMDRYNHAEIVIPRYLGDAHKTSEKQILWVFTDASKQAIAACAYVQNEKGKEVSTLLSGKAKLTPKIKVPLEDTIPKYELASILLGMEVARSAIQSLDLSNTKLHIVNDSTSALSWVTLSKRLRKSCELIKAKILNAVNSVNKDYNISTQFFHCASNLNIADIATRGVSPHELQNSDYINGPSWIGDSIENLPITPYTMKDSEPNESEHEEDITANPAIVTADPPRGIRLDQFKSAERAKWIIAMLIKLLKGKVEAMRTKRGIEKPLGALWSQLSSSQFPSRRDLAVAEKVIIIYEQSNVTTNLLSQRYRHQEVIDDEFGIKRFRSRIQNAELDYDSKNPMFLPNNSQYVKLVLKGYHEQFGHMGKEYMKMILRQRFWVPKPTKIISLVLKQCLPCRISNSLPFKAPNMPSLPLDRVQGKHAFENTGVDCLGPFHTVEQEKVYVCLFTCLVIRAVHLEIVNELSGAEFLKAFMRFTSRRGLPKIMRSDNGTNFVLAEKLVKAIHDSDENDESTIKFSNQQGITWIFNPPKAPFMGGVWERLVRTVKSSFFKTVGRRVLTLSDFHTSMVKIEAIVNSRPMTAIDNNDLIIPLRPCDFICPGTNLITPSFNQELDDSDYEPDNLNNLNEAKEKIAQIEKILDGFWGRFRREYLITLRDQQKLQIKQGRCAKEKMPTINEIVLIESDMLPKYKWKLGKIVELIHGNDGKIRSAILNCKGKRVHRPIISLYSLEIRSTEELKGLLPPEQLMDLEITQISENEDNIDSESEKPIVNNKRSVRNEAVAARNRIAICTKYLESDHDISDPETDI